MKRFLLIISLLSFVFIPQAMAGTSDVNFAWGANTEPDLVGYRLFWGTTSGGPYTQVNNDIICGPNDETCCVYTQTGVADGTYFWVLIAFDNEGFASEDSNEVTTTLDTAELGVPPEAPQVLIFKSIVEHP